MGGRNGTKMTLLSIIVPVTQMAGKLENLRSWVSLCDPEQVQILIVHDNRDQETGRELTTIIESSEACTLIDGRFGSPGIARNAGLSKSLGKWVMFADSDDFVFTCEALSLLMNPLEESVEVVCGSYMETSCKNSEEHRFDVLGESINSIIIKPGLWRFILRSDIAHKNPFRDFMMAEDQVYLIENKVYSRNIFFSEKIIYNYFVDNPSQATSNRKRINDLRRSIPYLIHLKHSCINMNVKQIDLAIISQTLTLLRRGSISSKFIGIILFLSNLNSNFRATLTFLQSRSL
jgi:glycosyltransferase involved in cell wall biosynthesis